MRTIGILQPAYLPWLGFFEQLWRCERFVLFDDVQFTRRSWRHRNRIRTAEGWAWLSVPVQEGARDGTIAAARIADGVPWARKHARTLEHAYRAAPYFSTYWDRFAAVYERPWSGLVDLDEALIRTMASAMGIEREVLRASDLGVGGTRTEHVAALCKKLGADHLYDGEAARYLLDVEALKRQGIEVTFQDFVHPVYSQCFEPFIPYLSAIDLLFSAGPGTLELVRGAGEGRLSSFCLCSGTTLLASYGEANLQRTFEWLQAPELVAEIDSVRPDSPDRQRQWFDDRRARPECRTFAIQELSGEHVGNLFLDFIEPAAGRARVSLYIGDPRHRGRQVGRAALGLALKYCFRTLRLSEVWLTVRPGNAAAWRLYDRWGFRPAPGRTVPGRREGRDGAPLELLALDRDGFERRAGDQLPAPLSA